ncbi:MAG: hypothetical protein ABMA13_23430 [Chthoniobacteraceae bacterium]
MNTSTKILTVSNGPLLSKLINAMLEHAGATVVIEETLPRQALRAMWAFRPQLIVIDLDPQMDDGEGAARLRGEAAMSGVPVIVLTERGDSGESRVAESERLMAKPVAPVALLSAVREAIGLLQRPSFAAATRAGAMAMGPQLYPARFCAA